MFTSIADYRLENVKLGSFQIVIVQRQQKYVQKHGIRVQNYL